MKSWMMTTIGEVCTVVPGQSPESQHYNTEGEGVPFYQGKKEFGAKYLGPPKIWTRVTAREARAGDILMSVRAPVGPINVANEQICIGRGLAAIRPSSVLDGDFLYYALLAKTDEISGSEGAVFASINKNQIEAIEVPLPVITEQKRIVTILDEVFAGIDAAVANVERNLANARDLFDSYLNSIFCRISAGWLQTTVGEHITFIDYRGRTPTKTESGLRLITAKNVKMGSLQVHPKEFVDPAIYEKWMTRGIPQVSDVLFTTEAPLANVAQLDTDERVVFAQRVIIMQPDRKVLDPNFLKFMLMSRVIQGRIHGEATGATAKGIKASRLKQVPISFPPTLSDQHAIVETLRSVEAESCRLEGTYRSKLTALAELKQSILQKAFAGELTAKDAETERAAA